MRVSPGQQARLSPRPQSRRTSLRRGWGTHLGPCDRRREPALDSKPVSHRGHKVAECRWDVGGDASQGGWSQKKVGHTASLSDLVTAEVGVGPGQLARLSQRLQGRRTSLGRGWGTQNGPCDRRQDSALDSKPVSHCGHKVAECRWDVGGDASPGGGSRKKVGHNAFLSDLVTDGESRPWAASPSLTAVTRSQNVAGTWVGDASRTL